MIFNWRGINPDGNAASGVMTARNQATVKIILTRQGVSRVKVRQVSSWQRRIKARIITRMFAALAGFLAGGIKLATALSMLLAGERRPVMQRLLHQLHTDINHGHSLSETLAHYPEYFDHTCIALIEAGEAADNISLMLQRLVALRKKREAIHQQLQHALAYPLLVLGVALVVTLIIVFGALPRFEQIFATMGNGSSLPGITRKLIDMVHWMQAYGGYILAGTLVSLLLMRRLLRLDLVKIPWIGKIYSRIMFAGISHTVAVLYQSGIQLVPALHVAARGVNDYYYQQRLEQVLTAIAAGATVHQAFAPVLADNTILQLLYIAETGGDPQTGFVNIADILTEEINNQLEILTNLLEPFIMCVLGIILGILLLAMYLPVFRMGTVI